MKSKRSLVFYFFQTIIRWFGFFNSRWSRMVKGLFPRQWVKEGECIQCGACCENPTLSRPTYYFKVPLLIKSSIYWHEFWYNFRFCELRPKFNQIVFTCPHLKADKQCDDYKHRPQMCRDYPEITSWFVKPDFFPSCGYKPVRILDREVDQFIVEFRNTQKDIVSKSHEKPEQNQDRKDADRNL